MKELTVILSHLRRVDVETLGCDIDKATDLEIASMTH